MKHTTTLFLLITAGLLLHGCIKNTPQSVLLQARRMTGQHTWHGTETDHNLPSYPDYRPAYDTSYTVSFGFAFYFQDDINMFIYRDTISESQHFYARGFRYASKNDTLKTLTYTMADDYYAIQHYDTLVYNYANNTITIVQHYTDSKGTYIVKIHTP